MKVGDQAELRSIFDAVDVAEYLALGGAPVAPGQVPEPLIGGLFSYLLGVRLPGAGTNYLKQQTDFLAPAALGTELLARVTVTRLRPEKHLVDLETLCLAGDRLIARGRALVYVGDRAQGAVK